ncbi:MAG: hypothetical protein ABIO70_05000 [Pseudomonadota bacterium]
MEEDAYHGGLSCTWCHGGTEPALDKHASHEGMITNPDVGLDSACVSCHPAEVGAFEGSMHQSLRGEHASVALRSGMDDWESDEVWAAGYDASCNSCHATCGECHISRPDSAGGGFVSGHKFERTPSMINQCTACHGSRIGEEFRGTHRTEIAGYQADVHYLASMRCEACHTAEEIHGASADHRYAVEEMPRCEDCHPDLDAANEYHETHYGTLSCQVCHAQDYKHCASCHVPDGLDESSELGFKIGLNPRPDDRPYTYVTLRHIPVVPDTFVGWGVTGELSGYALLPSFEYTTPHNIRRWTDRTTPGGDATCYGPCHDSPDAAEGWFLRQADLDRFPDEADANAPYIVPDGPPTAWDR